MNWNLAEQCKIVKGNTLAETTFSNTSYPASGAFIDVSGYGWVNVVIHLGTINAGDTPTFDLKCSDAINGTLDVLDATYCSHEIANDDDGEFVTFALNTDLLPALHTFVALVVSDGGSGSYGDIVFYLCQPRKLPVTQNSGAGTNVAAHEKAA